MEYKDKLTNALVNSACSNVAERVTELKTLLTNGKAGDKAKLIIEFDVEFNDNNKFNIIPNSNVKQTINNKKTADMIIIDPNQPDMLEEYA